jgi:hypothetical protein
MTTTLREAVALELCREAKVSDLLGVAENERFEASGVAAVDGMLYVIFDNRSEIGSFGAALLPADERSRLIRQQCDRDTGYEDIAHDASTGRFFILVEALPHRDGFFAMVREYDSSFAYIAGAWLDFPLAGPNKGLEGLACVRRAGQTYLLALCEGNRCADSEAGRRPGGGRIQVFARNGKRWGRVDTMRLPPTLPFEDYSSIALAGERLCVVSQESSALWVGRLAAADWRLADDGATFQFPRDDEGHRVYCNVEGVSWLSDRHVVVVSDKAKPDQTRRCRSKDQSIHVFALPAAAE